MKKLLLLLLLSFGFVSLSFAHSGRTDSSGGHNNYSNGTYHYHNSGTSSSSYDVDYDGNYRVCPDPPGYQRLSSGSGYCIGGAIARELCRSRVRNITAWCIKKEPKSTIGKVWNFLFGD